MFEQADSLAIHKLVDHVAEHGADGVESFVGVTDVREARLVKKNLLHDEDSDGFGELRSGFHNAKAEGYDLCRKKKVNYSIIVVLLHESSDDAQRRESEILEWSGFGGGV